jgi:hypothetical protein
LYPRLPPFGSISRGFPSRVVPSDLCKAGLPLTPSLDTEIAFARSDFFDIALSFTSFGPISLLLSLRLPLDMIGEYIELRSGLDAELFYVNVAARDEGAHGRDLNGLNH